MKLAAHRILYQIADWLDARGLGWCARACDWIIARLRTR